MNSKSTIQTIVTVFAWWTMFSGANLMVDESASRFLEANQLIGGLMVLAILAVGFLIGEAVAALVTDKEPT